MLEGGDRIELVSAPDCRPLIERFCSIIVSEVEENVMLRRWAKAQFGGEVGWRA
jgi:hypothetical protein